MKLETFSVSSMTIKTV